MTSAPSWASAIPPSGAATNAEPSTTRSPFRRSYMRSSGDRAGGTELRDLVRRETPRRETLVRMLPRLRRRTLHFRAGAAEARRGSRLRHPVYVDEAAARDVLRVLHRLGHAQRSEEHTSELQSLMRISYAVFCL